MNERMAASDSRSASETQSLRAFRSASSFPSCSQCRRSTAEPRRAASVAISMSFTPGADCSLCSPASMHPETLSHYRVERLIGAGGMGEVYLAEDTALHRKAALKLLPARFTRDEERVKRFKREARAASALNHPNIITIYEIGEADSVHYIATEFIEGETIRQRISRGTLPLNEVLDVGIGVAAA